MLAHQDLVLVDMKRHAFVTAVLTPELRALQHRRYARHDVGLRAVRAVQNPLYQSEVYCGVRSTSALQTCQLNTLEIVTGNWEESGDGGGGLACLHWRYALAVALLKYRCHRAVHGRHGLENGQLR